MEQLKSTQDPNGKKSSTRILSYWFTAFFFLVNFFILTSVLYGNKALDLNTMLFILIFDFLLLTAIFVPKNIAKIQEMQQVIEMLKK